jgi:exodeoxyribonuclease V alpha subunit
MADLGPASEVDPFGADRVRGASGMLAEFNAAGVLAAADIHVAQTLGRLCGEGDEQALLAAALAVRGPRLGHVCVDLSSVRATTTVEDEDSVHLDALAWPEPGGWVQALAASPLVGVEAGGAGGAGGSGGSGAQVRPLRLAGTRLYLDRYWRYEQRVVADLQARAARPAGGVDTGRLAEGLARLFRPVGDTTDLQQVAAAAAVRQRLAVVAGGPGTGKTRTVARILALLCEQGPADLRIALAAPTGKAAKRLEEAVRAQAAQLPVASALRERLAGLRATTLHVLLGWRPGARSRYRHHRGNLLPVDVVVVDETSMVSLSQLAKLLDAVRDDARVVLLGDPEQLHSIEAGAVLGDIVGPAADGLLLRAPAAQALAAVTGQPVPVSAPPPGRPIPPIADGIVVLREVFRFGAGSGIAALAGAVGRGDPDAVMAVLRAGYPDVAWLAPDAASGAAPDTAPDAGPGAAPGAAAGTADAALEPVRASVVAAGAAVVAAARAGDAASALSALEDLRVLCAHRRGPHGVAGWVARVEGWLREGVNGYGEEGTWYLGRPLLVTRNDYGLGLFNGEAGVVVAAPGGGVTAAFPGPAGTRTLSPLRLESVETVHATTIHKSQGSQFRHVVVVLPEPGSAILSRELLYTGVTRAEQQLTLVGSEAAVRAAVTRRVARASGLRDALWGG